MVKFCKRFFEQKRSLTNAYAFGSSQPGAAKFDISNYANRGMSQELFRPLTDELKAETMFRELLHLDLVADSAGSNPNPVVDDMTVGTHFAHRPAKISSERLQHTVPLAPNSLLGPSRIEAISRQAITFSEIVGAGCCSISPYSMLILPQLTTLYSTRWPNILRGNLACKQS